MNDLNMLLSCFRTKMSGHREKESDAADEQRMEPNFRQSKVWKGKRKKGGTSFFSVLECASNSNFYSYCVYQILWQGMQLPLNNWYTIPRLKTYNGEYRNINYLLGVVWSCRPWPEAANSRMSRIRKFDRHASVALIRTKISVSLLEFW